MKLTKVIIAGIMALAANGAFAWTNNVGFGLRAYSPLNTTVKSMPGTGDVEYKTANWGLNVMYVGYADSGFTVKDSFNLGGGKIENTDDEVNVHLSNYVGLGYGIVRTEKLYFGLLGTLGIDVNGNATADSTSDYTSTLAAFVLGGDATLIFTPVKTFSMYASFMIGGGFGRFRLEEKNRKTDAKTTVDRDLTPYLVISPTVGFCWKF